MAISGVDLRRAPSRAEGKMLTGDDIARGFERGSLLWWIVDIYGAGLGAEISRHRAERVGDGRWRYAREVAVRFTSTGSKRRDLCADIDGPIEMEIRCGEDLGVLSARGYATLGDARDQAMLHYVENSVVLADALNRTIAENRATIQTLMGAALAIEES